MVWLLTSFVLVAAAAQNQSPKEAPTPVASAPVRKLLAEALRSATADELATALSLAQQALAAAQQAADTTGEALSQREFARLLQESERKTDAGQRWLTAAAAWERVGDSPGRVEALAAAGLLVIPEKAADGRALLRQVLQAAQAETPRPLALADVLQAAGDAWSRGGYLAESRDLLNAALTLREKRAPGSLAVAASLNAIGEVMRQQGDLSAAREHHQRALALQQKLAPGSLDVAASLDALGLVAYEQRQLAMAKEYAQQALALRKQQAPDSLAVSATMCHLGLIAYEQGDLAAADQYHWNAFQIRNKLAPDSLEMAGTLCNLGLVAYSRGNLAEAVEHFRGALAIQETQAPGSPDVVATLNNLGLATQSQGDLTAAKEHFQRALSLCQKLAPASMDYAATLGNLGEVARAEGKLDEAREDYQQALAIQQKLAPDSLDIAISLTNLSLVAQKENNWVEAERRARQACEIVRRQANALTGDEALQAFGTASAVHISNLIRTRVALKQHSEAFTTLEEGRAYALRHLIAERGIAARIINPKLGQAYQRALSGQSRASKALEQAGEAEAKARRDLEAQQAQQAAESVLAEKRQTLATAQLAVEQAQVQFTRCRVETEQRWQEIVRSAPRVFPPALDAEQARRSLPAGTLLASFAVDEEESTLFLVWPDRPVRSYVLHVPLAEMQAKVAFVRKSISGETGGRAAALAGEEDTRVDAARTLFQKLFPPEARQAIAAAKRLVLSPDGALWGLPFGALIINESGSPRYLGLEKPLSYAQSLTVLSQSLRAPVAPTAQPALRALVVGNPLYDAARRAAVMTAARRRPVGARGRSAPVSPRSKSGVRSAAPRVRTARKETAAMRLLTRDGDTPPPLPYAETEAREVARLYGTTAGIGAEPTEAWFRQRAPSADMVHLATHGYFTASQAMSSGVRLAVPESAPPPGQTDNDGALQAWEFFSDAALRLKAELVVLSACETGLGQQVPGEGLVGLTRALQVAGARSIVASQWAVADASTERLMVALHRELRAGMGKDEALRRAMVVLQREPTTAHPYFWAPFVLFGDPENHRLRAVKSTSRPGRKS